VRGFTLSLKGITLYIVGGLKVRLTDTAILPNAIKSQTINPIKYVK
jgi:hypothetical protein